MDCVRELVGHSPRKSVCHLFAESSIHHASVQCILRDDLHLISYKIQSQSELTPEQKALRLNFGQWFLGKLVADEHFIEKIHLTDDCFVHLSGLINKQNFRYLEADNPGNNLVNKIPRSVVQVMG